jgi:uncharacterized protein
MEEPFKCYMVSWDEAQRLARILSRKIKRSGFRPDLVIGIARGGLVPARIVCDYLLQKDLASVKVEHWGIAATLGKAEVKFPLPVDISGKKVLVVDDVADTGDTFSVLVEYLKKKHPEELRTAVLQYKTCSTFIPDFWGEKQEEWLWIIYPWAVYEDLTGFIERVLTHPMTFDEIKRSLNDRFGINIGEMELHEMLEDMHESDKLKTLKQGDKKLWKNIESC